MKKLSEKQKLFLKKQSIRIRKCSKRKTKNSKQKFEKIIFSNELTLFIPSERSKVIKVIQAIRNGQSNKLYLDFSDVETLNPLTALYLKQVLDRHRNAKFKSKFPKDNLPRAVFKMLGYNQRFNLKDINNAKYHTYVDDWDVFSGNNMNLPEEAQQKLVEIKELVSDDNLSFKLNNAIMEAVNNVVQHAYEDDNEDYNKWFMLFRLSKQDKSLAIVVSDLGLSIPYTVPSTIKEVIHRTGRELMKKVFMPFGSDSKDYISDQRGLSDSQLIKVATRLNITRTNTQGRGKGFEEILALAKNTEEYTGIKKIVTTVLSRSGSYFYQVGSSGEVEKSYQGNLQDYPDAIQGTVISWFIRLD